MTTTKRTLTAGGKVLWVRFLLVALATSGTRAVLDAPAAAFAVTFLSLLPPANALSVGEFELAPAPPPRNLLLVKNSFLI